MAAASQWRARCRPVIARVMLEAGPGADADSITRALSDAYPFGERKHHPYKIWLEEVHAALVRRFSPTIASTQALDRPCRACGARAGAYCVQIDGATLDLAMLHEAR